MNDQTFLYQFNKLPTNLQNEVLDFIAFLLNKQEKREVTQQSKPPVRKAGSMKGLITYIADDFDAPLEDFKEYM
jgi:hypothetical protein